MRIFLACCDFYTHDFLCNTILVLSHVTCQKCSELPCESTAIHEFLKEWRFLTMILSRHVTKYKLLLVIVKVNKIITGLWKKMQPTKSLFAYFFILTSCFFFYWPIKIYILFLFSQFPNAPPAYEKISTGLSPPPYSP